MTDRNYPAYVAMVLNAMGQKRGKEIIKACHEDYCPCAFNDFYPTPMDAVLYDRIVETIGNRAPHVYSALLRNIEDRDMEKFGNLIIGIQGLLGVYYKESEKPLDKAAEV